MRLNVAVWAAQLTASSARGPVAPRSRPACFAVRMRVMQAHAVLFCCTGNICRSPAAEGLFAKRVADAGLSDRILADSAGTHGHHIGEPPDARMQRAARARGCDLSALRARRFERADFMRFDLVLAMDKDNRAFLARLCPPACAYKLKLMMEYARRHPLGEVPDPYDRGPEAFDQVVELLDDATEGLLLAIAGRQSFKR